MRLRGEDVVEQVAGRGAPRPSSAPAPGPSRAEAPSRPYRCPNSRKSAGIAVEQFGEARRGASLAGHVGVELAGGPGRGEAWDYLDVVPRYLRPSDAVLDVGTGAGEMLRVLASSFGCGLGIDADPEMVWLAREKPAPGNLSFQVCSKQLDSVPGFFDMILDRHAPFDLSAIAARLRPGGYFITQQVGERNMAYVKAALGHAPGRPLIQRYTIAASGLRLLALMEYQRVRRM